MGIRKGIFFEFSYTIKEKNLDNNIKLLQNQNKNNANRSFAKNKLKERNGNDLTYGRKKILLGVCYKIARLVSLPVTLVRVIVMILFLLYPGEVFLGYFVLFVLIKIVEKTIGRSLDAFKYENKPYFRIPILLALYRRGGTLLIEDLIDEFQSVVSEFFSMYEKDFNLERESFVRELKLMNRERLIYFKNSAVSLTDKGQNFIKDYIEKRSKILGG